jgi:hypothetical protein
MANLSFLDKLDKDQLINADKIISKAQEIGVDPRLALSLAFVESGFKMGKVGADGEIGIMQVKPDTAKMLGVDIKSLRDEDINIDTGLKYLKQGIDRYKDPQLGVLAYNAGHDAPFLTGKSEEPPATTLSYLNKINALGGFVPTPTPEAAPDDKGGKGGPPPAPASEEDFRRLQAAGTGAAIGAGTGAITDVKRAVLGGGPDAARSGTPVQKWGQAMGYNDRGAQTFAQAHEFEQGTRKGATMRNPATGQTFKPEFNVQRPPVIEPNPSPLQKGLGMAQKTGEVMSRYPIISNTLAGAGAGFAGQDAMTRYNKGDMAGAAIAGLGAAGSLASMIPHPLTKGLGAGVSMASPAALMVLDKMRQQTARQPQRALSETDAMGNPMQ